jgi:WD40 repeat protein
LSVKAHQQTENPILKVSFSPDDRLLAAVVYSDQMVEIWRIANSQLVRSRSIPQGTNPLSVSFSPNSQMIATGGEDGKVKLWRVSDAKLLKSFPHNDLVYDVAFHSQEMLVSGGKNKEVKFWRIADGKEVKRFVYGDAIYSIAFNPDRQLIVAAGQAGTIKIWRITDGQMIASLPNGNPVNSISFSSDNSTIVSSDENLIRLWHIFSNQPKDVKLTPMLEDACQYLNDYLSTSKTLIQQSDREICKDID